LSQDSCWLSGSLDMRHALKFLGDMPWYAVLLPSIAIFAVTSYYALPIERQHDALATDTWARPIDLQIGDISQRLGQFISNSDGEPTTITIGGGDNPQVFIRSGTTSGSKDAMSGKRKVSEEDLIAQGIITEEPIAEAEGSSMVLPANPPKKNEVSQVAANSRDLKIAIEGELRNVVQTAVAGYRIRSNLLLIGFVTLLLSLLIVTKAMISRQRGTEIRVALADSEVERSRLQAKVTTAQLAIMQAQIEPHFLFNTMASVQHLIETDPAKAAQLQQNLIQYLRTAIPQMRESNTTLGREIELAHAYLGILRARMEERLKFSINLPPRLKSVEFPTMMILTLLENAIKHGLEPKPQGGEVKISAAIKDEKLVLEVVDTGIGFSPNSGSGIGLANIRERLRLLYGKDAALMIERNDPTGTRATITIPSPAAMLTSQSVI
jgi:signal transduction histidine kinase